MEKSTSDQEIQQKVETVSVANENQNAGIHQLDQAEANTLSHGINGNQHGELLNSIKVMAASLDPPLSSKNCCICRIPNYLRKLNKEAYTPKVISIGPFYHGNKRLETMEKLKLKYFKKFLQRIDFKYVEDLVNDIKLDEERVRSCYAETIKFSSDDFVKLILVDGIFIIELFCEMISHDVFRENNILLNPTSQVAMMSDMQLLENQLPFFVLEKLFSYACGPNCEHPSFLSLAVKVFKGFIGHHFPGNLERQQIRHFVDLTKAFFLPSSLKQLSEHESNDLASADHFYTISQLYKAGVKFMVRSCKRLHDLTRHFADHFARAFSLPSCRKPVLSGKSNDLSSADHLYSACQLYKAGVKFVVRSCKLLHDLTRHFADHFSRAFSLPSCRKSVLSDENNDLFSADHLYSACQLYEAGVKFKVISSKCFLDLKFNNGTLEIPCMNLYNLTETTYRNIIAFEQCHYPYCSNFIDYIVLLSFLINTPKDADLLIRKGIIINWLPNSDAVASLFTNLFMNVAYDGTESVHCELFKELNAFYENTKHTWKATLKRDYFGTPWKIASTAAAVILLLLTLIQTICSIIQVVKM